MKKYLAACLVVVMLFTGVTPALAADLFQENGPWGTWTEEQTTAAEKWTEADWEGYWGDYEEIWDKYSLYFEDMDEWNAAKYGQVLDEFEEARRAEMGLPFPKSSTNVVLNGKNLDFGGTAPIGEVYGAQLPLRAFVETLGGKVGYQDGKITATLTDGTEFAVGLKDSFITYTVGDKLEKLALEKLPTVDGARGVTYVDAAALATLAGLDIYVDGDYGILYLTDWAVVAKELDSHYTKYNAILKAGFAPRDETKTYEIAGDADVKLTLYGEKQHATGGVTCKFSNKSDAKTVVGTNVVHFAPGDLKGLIEPLFQMEGMEQFRSLQDITTQTISNKETQDVYTKSTGVDSSFGIPSGEWIHMGEEMPFVDQSELISEQPTVGNLICTMMRSPYVGSLVGGTSASPYAQAQKMDLVLQVLFGDDTITEKTTGSTTTYAAKLDTVAIAKKAADLGLLKDMNLGELLGKLNATPKLDYQFSATVQKDRLTRLSLTSSLQMEGAFPVTLSVGFTESDTTAQAKIAIKGGYLGKLEATMKLKTAVTNEVLPTQPPKGETVHQWEEVMKKLQEKWNAENENLLKDPEIQMDK